MSGGDTEMNSEVLRVEIGEKVTELLPEHSLLYKVARKAPVKISEREPSDEERRANPDVHLLPTTLVDVLPPNLDPTTVGYLRLGESLIEYQHDSGLVEFSGYMAEQLVKLVALYLDQQFIDHLLRIGRTKVGQVAKRHADLFGAYGHSHCIIAPSHVAEGARWHQRLHDFWLLDEKSLTVGISGRGHPTFDHDPVVLTANHHRPAQWNGMKIEVPNFRFWVDPDTVTVVAVHGDQDMWWRLVR